MNEPYPLSESERKALIERYFKRADKFPGIYLANHSLGRPLDQMVDNLNYFSDLWFHQMDDAWDSWLKALEEYQSLVAELLTHPRPDGIILKTSMGQGLRAVLNALYAKSHEPVNVVTTGLEFDSADFILRQYEKLGLVNLTVVSPTLNEGPVPLIDSQEVINAISNKTDLVVISHAIFQTGQIINQLDEIIETTHANDAYIMLDTYHTFGVIPLDFKGLDFAVGGSYKYIHGGPGACWLAVSPKILDEQPFLTPDTGWFAKKDLFGYQRISEPEVAEDGRAWWESTPPIVAVYQALSGLKYIKEVGVDRLRITSLDQQDELRESFVNRNIPVFTPKDPEQFGAFTLLPSSNAKEITQHLKDYNITVDSRGDFVRLCPDILNTKEDFDQVAEVLAIYLSKKD